MVSVFDKYGSLWLLSTFHSPPLFSVTISFTLTFHAAIYVFDKCGSSDAFPFYFRQIWEFLNLAIGKLPANKNRLKIKRLLCSWISSVIDITSSS